MPIRNANGTVMREKVTSTSPSKTTGWPSSARAPATIPTVTARVRGIASAARYQPGPLNFADMVTEACLRFPC